MATFLTYPYQQPGDTRVVKAVTIARRKRVTPLAGRDSAATMGCWRCRAYTPYTRHICQHGNCTEFYCGRCRRATGGAGPAGCPCDSTPHGSAGFGHHTKNEQPRLPVPAKRWTT